MTNIRRATQGVVTWLERYSPLLLVPVFMLTLLFGGISLKALQNSNEANVRIAHEADARAQDAQAQAEHQRLTFCGLFEPIANLPTGTPAPASSLGQQIVKGSQFAVSPPGLGCTPDPTDGK
jgi:hypothetical protein